MLRLGLRYQHAVEWVFVGTRQEATANCMFHCNGQHLKSFALHLSNEVSNKIYRRRQFAQTYLGRDFPGRRSANNHSVTRVRNHTPRRPR